MASLSGRPTFRLPWATAVIRIIPMCKQPLKTPLPGFARPAKLPGIIATDEALARRYLSLGCTFIALGLDVSLLARATQDLARKFKPSSDISTPSNAAGAPY